MRALDYTEVGAGLQLEMLQDHLLFVSIPCYTLSN